MGRGKKNTRPLTKAERKRVKEGTLSFQPAGSQESTNPRGVLSRHSYMVYTGDLDRRNDAREVAPRQNQTSDNSWVHGALHAVRRFLAEVPLEARVSPRVRPRAVHRVRLDVSDTRRGCQSVRSQRAGHAVRAQVAPPHHEHQRPEQHPCRAASRIPRKGVALGQSSQANSPQSRILCVPGVPRWSSPIALGATSAPVN